MRMKAALFHGPGRPLTVGEVPRPEPGPGEVLVRVAACGVCHTDLHYLDHNVPTAKPPPMILGHEVSGVVETGAGPFRPGDRVILPAVLSCGDCALCRAGRTNICEKMRMYGNHVDGAFAEFVTAPARELFRLPDSVPLEEACVIGDAVTTAYHAAVGRGRVRPGETAAVFGCGGVGINVVQMAAAHGAVVFAIDVSSEKLELAARLGARRTFQPGPDLAKQIRKAAGGGVDVAFECVGRPETIRQAHESIRRGGRLCLVGYCEKPVEMAVSRIMFLEHDVVGSLGCPPADYPKVLELIARGAVQIVPLVSRRFPLDRINDAFDALRRGEGIRNIVRMDGNR